MAGIVRAVKFSRLLSALAMLSLCAGCQTTRYTKLRATDYSDRLIAEWVAEGDIDKVENGYRITAVERLSGPPFMTLSKYPDGWRTTVTGPHIVRWRCGKPLWLYDLERGITREELHPKGH